jgi:hypothetical protein
MIQAQRSHVLFDLLDENIHSEFDVDDESKQLVMPTAEHTSCEIPEIVAAIYARRVSRKVDLKLERIQIAAAQECEKNGYNKLAGYFGGGPRILDSLLGKLANREYVVED